MDICYYYNKNLSKSNKETSISIYENSGDNFDNNTNPKFDDDDIWGDDDIESNNYPDYLYEEAGY